MLSILIAVLILPGELAAKPKIKVSKKYYSISGSTTRELKQQMRRKGPGGFWARADWRVSWFAGCQVTVEIKYQYPKWENRSGAPADVRRKWDRMMKALVRHEEQHGRHGINAGNEIDQSKCSGSPKKITEKWARQDKIYDRQTKHGKTEGVVLP